LQEIVSLNRIIWAALEFAEARVLQRDVKSVYAAASADRAGKIAVFRILANYFAWYCLIGVGFRT